MPFALSSTALLALLLAGCDHGKDADGDGWSVRGDDCDDENPSVNPDASEDCSSGADDDCDGLVDCEDGDCAGKEPCTEDCDLPGDEDGDGLADCEDDECWYWNCLFHSRVQYGAYARWSAEATRSGFWGGGVAASVDGTVRVGAWYISSSPGFTCSWHADYVMFEFYESWRSMSFFHSLAEAWRSGFALSAACPFTEGSVFLPAPMAGGCLLDAWGTFGTHSVVTTESWYTGDPNLLRCSSVGSTTYNRRREASWSMAPVGGGGTFVTRLASPD